MERQAPDQRSRKGSIPFSTTKINGVVVQLGERLPCKQEVAVSSTADSTKNIMQRSSKWTRTPHFQCGQCGFESRSLYQNIMSPSSSQVKDTRFSREQRRFKSVWGYQNKCFCGETGYHASLRNLKQGFESSQKRQTQRNNAPIASMVDHFRDMEKAVVRFHLGVPKCHVYHQRHHNIRSGKIAQDYL